MTIEKLIIENFKGVKDCFEFEIKPLTIFCGANSTGKSSCIHALAALAQTTKLSASKLPIVLDDEYAHVHLGRFLDVIHSKNIKDSFSIGLRVDGSEDAASGKDKKNLNYPIQARYYFQAVATTQEVYVKSATMSWSGTHYEFKRKKISDEDFHFYKQNKKYATNAYSAGRFSFSLALFNEKEKAPNKTQIDDYIAIETISRSISGALRNTYYLGPFRQGPLRRYPTRGSQPTEVGAAGESSVVMLANEVARSKTHHPKLEQVSGWIQKLGLGKKLVVAPVAKTDLVDVSVTLDDGADLPLPDLGFGVSQVLPVLVQCAYCPASATLLFEQPELHLHDSAARQLAGVFVDIINEKSAQIIAETHSRVLFHEIINEVKAKRIRPEDVILYDVTRQDGSSKFKKINIEMDTDGNCEVDHPWGKDL